MVKRFISVELDELRTELTITANVSIDNVSFTYTYRTKPPLSNDVIQRFISSINQILDIDEKIVETLGKEISPTEVQPMEVQPTETPSHSVLPYEPPKSHPSFENLITRLREIYPNVPSEVLDRVIGVVADKCQIPRERFFKLTPNEVKQLEETLFAPVGEQGIQQVLTIETIVAGKYEIPTDQQERRLLLAQAREFVRNHPILSKCEENVNQLRIDNWRGAFLSLYEIYRLNP